MKAAWGIVYLAVLASVATAAELDPPHPQLGRRAELVYETAPIDSTQWPTATGVVLQATDDPTRFLVIPVRVGPARIALASGDTISWEVEPRLSGAAADSLRPLHRIGDLGPNFAPAFVIIAAALALIGWLLWRRFRADQSAPSAFELPARPPHEVALERLEEIRVAGWIGQGRFDEVYVQASHALRDYVGGRFRVPALDWTTAETVDRLQNAGYEGATVAAVGPLLTAADAVKFAAQRPTEHQADQWLTGARDWIEGTAVEAIYTTPEAIAAARTLHGGRKR